MIFSIGYTTKEFVSFTNTVTAVINKIITKHTLPIEKIEFKVLSSFIELAIKY